MNHLDSEFSSVAAVILAGGKSRRMGCDKSQLTIAGNNLIEHSKNILKRSGIDEIFMSGKNGILDLFENKGPLSGIFTCLKKLESYQHVLFTPVDMPLLNEDIFKQLIYHKNMTACYFDDSLFPVIINNNQKTRADLSQLLIRNDLSIKNMLNSIAAHALENQYPDHCFLNANNSKDWENIMRYFKLND
ncbi:MAG: molybdenum cofactor guanylyltransferase [Marinicellaceae bacterium]